MVGEIEKLCQKQETEKLNGSKKKNKKKKKKLDLGSSLEILLTKQKD